MPTPREVEDRAVSAALALARRRAWTDVTLADVAEQAELPVAAVYRVLPSKSAVVDAFLRRVDDELAKPTDELAADYDEKDQLFDALMSCLEALEVEREAVRSIYDALRCDPLSLLVLGPALLRSMNAVLDRAGAPGFALGRLLRARLLGVVWIRLLPVWLEDDPHDLARTMAFLDREIRRYEMLTSLCVRRPERAASSSESKA